MYIVGGMPEYSSRSIERYSFEGDFWEFIELSFPVNMYLPAMFCFEPSKVAVFGGFKVFVIESERIGEDAPGRVLDEIVRLYEIDNLRYEV
mmetsp:Transcript_7848/g.1024  ORF Transcript_7848/g.1024 Transcript_7848/m.1024 type:complete len:91 (+) Transcript_7848:1079-1351(+)